MTVRVERAVVVPASPSAVWSFIADPEKRARPISVVEDFDLHDDGTATWHLSLPIPLIDRTIAVTTEETRRERPTNVEFEGRSRALYVLGEHELADEGETTSLTNRFTVQGRVPGVERFFRRRMDREFDNLEAALYEDLGLQP